MPLAAGSRLGPDEIQSALGAGGMGEVYRARDTKLNRDVALKILPEAFTLDGDRIARFRREAQVLASLNHPNIAAIYGFEDSGRTHALVLELVEGPTLADRIAQGAVPLDEALPIARQIAEALEAAHEQGIIHRDLKPANIKVTRDDKVKVLDFGLAKMLETGDAAPTGRAGAQQLTNSPTITTPAMMTGVGMILGTAAYMSPEQAKGRSADKRSDIWAFGCVLYEMLTGKPAFHGEGVADTLAAVLRGDPDWSVLSSDLPPAIPTLIRRCLAKNPRDRVADISTASFLLHERSSLSPPATGSTTALAAAASARRVRLWMTASIVLPLAVAAVMLGFTRRPRSESARPMRFEITLPASQALASGNIDRNFALSPDGTLLVYVSGGGQRLMVRSMDCLETEPLGNIFGARFPFFSPDRKWVGYFAANGELRKVSVTGGLPLVVCRYTGVPRGATWGPDDTIVFATNDVSTGLLAVPAGGGEPKALTKPDDSHGELDHILPSWLPDGRGVLFTITGTAPSTPGQIGGQVAILDSRTGRYRALLTGTEAEYVSSGHLVYFAQGTLRAVGFETASLTVLGMPEAIESLASVANGSIADFSISRTGILVYAALPPGVPAVARSLAWVTRQGKEEPIGAGPHAYVSLHLSPDDSRIALDARDQQNNIWIWDARGRTLTRLTDGMGDQSPVWTPDGRRVVFSSVRQGPRRLFWQFADGTGTLQQVTTGSNAVWPAVFSPDGSRLVVTEIGRITGDDVSMISFGGDKPSTPLVSTMFAERSPDLSRDGQWIAYQSTEDGQDQIYVRPFPDVKGGRWQITTAGGTHPIWGKNGRELFYLDGEGFLTGVPIQTTPAFSVGQRARILQTKYYSSATRGAVFDVTSDDQRFVMIKGDEGGGLGSTLVVVLNWTELLKQRVPTK